MTNIARFFEIFFGRNSDPGHPTMRRDDLTCNLPSSLDHPATVETLKKIIRTPLDYLYFSTILSGVLQEDFIEAANNINYLHNPGRPIKLQLLPKELRYLDYSLPNQELLLCLLLNTAVNHSIADKSGQLLLDYTNGKYKRISLFRIMKTATSTLENFLRHSILGAGPYRPSFKPLNNPEPSSIHGQLGSNDLVECSWNPLAYVTNSYNYAHAHYPIFDMNKPSEKTYSVLSIRDPIDRICSLHRSIITRNKFSSIEDFIQNCHRDYLAGQLYFCNQLNDLKEAINSISTLSRILIVENSSEWSEILSSDLNISIFIPDKKLLSNQVIYERDTLKSKVSSLIEKDNLLSSLIHKEYKLLEHARKLASKSK